MEKMVYRKAKEEDIESIAILVSKLLGTCNLNKGNSIIDNNINEITKTIKNYYVCEINSKIVGACGLSNIMKCDKYNFHLKNIREILYLVVEKNYQGKGIGTKLLKICCNNQDVTIIYEAWGDNGKYVNSKFVLEKCGFELYKDLGNDYYKNNGYCPLCVNKNKECNSCLAQIWIKKSDYIKK